MRQSVTQCDHHEHDLPQNCWDYIHCCTHHYLGYGGPGLLRTGFEVPQNAVWPLAGLVLQDWPQEEVKVNLCLAVLGASSPSLGSPDFAAWTTVECVGMCGTVPHPEWRLIHWLQTYFEPRERVHLSESCLCKPWHSLSLHVQWRSGGLRFLANCYTITEVGLCLLMALFTTVGNDAMSSEITWLIWMLYFAWTVNNFSSKKMGLGSMPTTNQFRIRRHQTFLLAFDAFERRCAFLRRVRTCGGPHGSVIPRIGDSFHSGVQDLTDISWDSFRSSPVLLPLGSTQNLGGLNADNPSLSWSLATAEWPVRQSLLIFRGFRIFKMLHCFWLLRWRSITFAWRVLMSPMLVIHKLLLLTFVPNTAANAGTKFEYNRNSN